MTTNNNKGFTLIEILIALMIFAFIAVMTSIGLRNITNSRNALEKRSKSIATLQLALTIMQQDISQIVNRGASQDVEQQPALQATADSITFTTANNPNIGGLLPHSDLFRVKYSAGGAGLTRSINLFVDQGQNSKPISETILPDVSGLTFKFINDQGQVLTYWYSQATNFLSRSPSANLIPQAIIVDMNLKGFGKIERIIQIGGHYFATK